MAAQDNRLSVTLAEGLTIQSISEAHTTLAEALDVNSNLTIAIPADADVDLTLVQLLEAGRRSAAGAGGGLELSAPASGGLVETLRRGGFLQTAEQRAFWLMESGKQ